MGTHRRAEVEIVKDELRCKRSDGKRWRCSAPAMSGRTLCEKHYKISQCREKRKKDEKTTEQTNSIQAVSSFAQGNQDLLGKRKASDGNADCGCEQKSRETDFDDNSGPCESVAVISGRNMEAEVAAVDSVARHKSLTRMTLDLLLQNLTGKDFIKNIVTLKVQGCKDDLGAAWKVFECNPYILGEENPDMYFSFLNYLCKLAEEDHTIVDDIFGVAEKGSTGEGDRIEYLFKSFSPKEIRPPAVFKPVEGIYVTGYSRQLPSPKQWEGMTVWVHLTLPEFLKGEEHLSALKGAALPIAQLLPTYESRIV